ADIVRLTEVRDVAVEDLLDRAPVQIDVDALRAAVRGRTILVTGAGGSIGSEGGGGRRRRAARRGARPDDPRHRRRRVDRLGGRAAARAALAVADRGARPQRELALLP